MRSGRFLHSADSIFKRCDTCLDAGEAGDTKDGLRIFPDFISSHAAKDGKHYFRYGAAGGGGYQIADENRPIGEFD